jgi:hypothetical protein
LFKFKTNLIIGKENWSRRCLRIWYKNLSMKKILVLGSLILLICFIIVLFTGVFPTLNQHAKDNYGTIIKIFLLIIISLVVKTNYSALMKNENRNKWFVRYGIVFSFIGLMFFIIGFLKPTILHNFWNFGLASLLIGVGCTLYSSLKFTCEFMEGFLPKITASFCLISIFYLSFLIGSKIHVEIFYTIAKIVLAISSLLSLIVIVKRSNN